MRSMPSPGRSKSLKETGMPSERKNDSVAAMPRRASSVSFIEPGLVPNTSVAYRAKRNGAFSLATRIQDPMMIDRVAP